MHWTEKYGAFLSVLLGEALELTVRESTPQQLKRNLSTSKFEDKFRAEIFLEQSKDCFIPENVDTEVTAAIWRLKFQSYKPKKK